MAVSPVLVVKTDEDISVNVRARLYDDFTEHKIVLNSVIAYWWANDLPPAKKFLELLDSVIKRTVNELMPHKILNLKYDVRANASLDDASELEVEIISVDADGVGFKIDGGKISLAGLRKVPDDFETSEFNMYTLSDLEKALNFALISENWLNNPTTYSDAIAIKVKLHSLIISENAKFFNYPVFVNVEQYLASLLINNGRKNQILNINIEDIDDSIAKVIVKIFSRMIFEYSKRLQVRGSVPFNLLIEEAHRYIKTGEDIDLLGYNIFDRISKEGRKYGVLLTLISQRPVELSETVMSQCANFLIFKTTHPRDIEYITRMVPYITEEIIEKQKGLQPGYCLAFGSAFKVPIIICVDIPNPVPNSSNVNVIKEWGMNK